jgi:methionyl-tRNA formyltransferase
MKAVLVSRYPRVDTPAWKRRVAGDLLDGGFEVEVLYSRSSIADQARDGLREEGLGLVSRYLALRAGRGSAPQPTAEPAMSLAAWARERGCPVHHGSRLGDEETLAWLRSTAPDLLILTGADIAPASLLRIPRVGTINAHYGLLPAYRGMNVTEWSVYHGDPVGVTVHLVDPGIDTGDILLREEIPLAAGETFATLRAKHQDLAARLLVQAALALRDGREERQTQAAAEGRQFYRMHEALRAVAEARLEDQAAGA